MTEHYTWTGPVWNVTTQQQRSGHLCPRWKRQDLDCLWWLPTSFSLPLVEDTGIQISIMILLKGKAGMCMPLVSP